MKPGMLALLQGFGDTLGLRRERGMRWVARMLAWFFPLIELTAGAILTYTVLIDWPFLFITSQPLAPLISGSFIVFFVSTFGLLALSQISTWVGLFATRSGWIQPNGAYTTSDRALARALIAAARARDPLLAPHTPASVARVARAEQSGATPPTAPAVEPETIAGLAHPLRHTATYNDPIQETIGALLALGGVGSALYLAVIGIAPYVVPSDTVGDSGLAALGLVAGALVAFFGAWLIAKDAFERRFARVIWQNISATVDSEGVTLTYPDERGDAGEQVRIAWRDVKSICTFNYQLGSTAYLLDAENTTVIWDVTSSARGASRRLAQAAQARTGLPLLDLTETLDDADLVANGSSDAVDSDGMPTFQQPQYPLLQRAYTAALREGDEESAREFWRFLHPPRKGKTQREPNFARLAARMSMFSESSLTRQRVVAVTLELLRYLPGDAESDPAVQDGRLSVGNPGRSARRVGTQLRSAIAIGIVYIVWVCLFMLLPAQIVSATAGYSVPLERALPTTIANMSPRVSTLTGAPQRLIPDASGFYVPAGANMAMGDGAVEVTLTLSDHNSAGILLEAPTQHAGVAFTLSADGYWSLVHVAKAGGSWRVTDMLGPDDENYTSIAVTDKPVTLLVVRRGLTYLVYIDGQFITAARDANGKIAGGGSVALFYHGYGAQTNPGPITVSNFRIYPTPDGLPFWAR